MTLTGSGRAITAQLNEALHHYHEDDILAGLTGLTRLHLVQAQARRHPALEVDAALRTILDQSLDELARRKSPLADVLARRFVQRKTVAEVARELYFSERTIHSRQEEALDRIAQKRTLGTVADELRLLDEISQVMKDASICGLGQTAASVVQSAVTRLKMFEGDAR